VVRPKLAYAHEEKALLINLIQRDLIFLLIPQEYSPSLESKPTLQEYIFSLCTFTLRLSFLASFDLLYLRFIYNVGLQLLFIGFYNTTPIWTMR